jgi:hypothetical protein
LPLPVFSPWNRPWPCCAACLTKLKLLVALRGVKRNGSVHVTSYFDCLSVTGWPIFRRFVGGFPFPYVLLHNGSPFQFLSFKILYFAVLPSACTLNVFYPFVCFQIEAQCFLYPIPPTIVTGYRMESRRSISYCDRDFYSLVFDV